MRHKFNALFSSSSSSSSFSSSLHFSFLFVLLLVVCYSPAFCFASSSPSTSSTESFDESDYNYYYYDYGYNNNNNNQTTPPCSEQCTDFGNNSAACLKSCDTCGYDTTQGQCIFIAVGSWGCPDGGDNVILGQGVSNSCTNDALTACDVVTAGFFLANCVSGGLYLFTFWSFVWVARSSGRYDSLLKYTVATALINIAAFIPLAVVLYVYVYCTAGKVVFIANAVISLTCWIITLFRSCGWYPLNGETDEADTLADRDEKSVQMPARSSGAAARQTQLKQVNIVPTAAASEAEAEGEIEMTTHTNPTATETAVAASGTGGGGVGAGAVQRIGRPESAPVVAAVPNGRALALAADGRPSHSLSDSDSESNPLSVENLSMHAAAPVNMRLNADGHTPPFTATIA